MPAKRRGGRLEWTLHWSPGQLHGRQLTEALIPCLHPCSPSKLCYVQAGSVTGLASYSKLELNKELFRAPLAPVITRSSSLQGHIAKVRDGLKLIQPHGQLMAGTRQNQGLQGPGISRPMREKEARGRVTPRAGGNQLLRVTGSSLLCN